MLFEFKWILTLRILLDLRTAEYTADQLSFVCAIYRSECFALASLTTKTAKLFINLALIVNDGDSHFSEVPILASR